MFSNNHQGTSKISELVTRPSPHLPQPQKVMCVQDVCAYRIQQKTTCCAAHLPCVLPPKDLRCSWGKRDPDPPLFCDGPQPNIPGPAHQRIPCSPTNCPRKPSLKQHNTCYRPPHHVPASHPHAPLFSQFVNWQEAISHNRMTQNTLSALEPTHLRMIHL